MIHLVNKTSKICDKCPRCVEIADTQRYSLHCTVKQGQEENPHSWGAGTTKCFCTKKQQLKC